MSNPNEGLAISENREKKMIKKRIIASILIVVLLTASLGIPVQAEENNEQENIEANVKVMSEDSFGEMTADLLEGEIEEQEENDGCNIFSIEVNGNQADVEFETNQYASLIIAVYDESGDKLIASGDLDVEPGDEEAVVKIETDVMPEYFYLRGFMADYETLEPVCTSYESPNYTKEMQEFLAKTTDDFKGEKILNFDDDKSNNFAVYNDETVVIQETDGENEVVQADEQNQEYVIDNADKSISLLKPGDIFSYEYDDGTVLIVKVASIRMDGTTARITGAETSLEEVFDYVKIDAEQYAGEAEIDDSTCDEGVIYEGLEESHSARAVDVDIENSSSVSLKLKKELGESFSLNGSLKLKMGASLKLYVSWTYQYVELKLNYSAGVNASFSGESDKLSIELVNMAFMPVPGVIIDITPSFVAKVSGKIELSGTLSGCIGFSVSNEKGMKNLTKNPVFDAELKSEAVVFIGLSLEPAVKIISDTIAKVEIGAEAGVELKAEQSAEKEEIGVVLHECGNCFDGDVTARGSLSFGVSLLKILEYKLSKDINVKVADFYWSVDYGEFAFTTCPHMVYRVTVIVEDSVGKSVEGAQINDNYITDKKGSAELYLSKGKHTITVKKETLTKRKKIAIKNKGKEITIILDGEITEEPDPEKPKAPKVVDVDMEQYFGAAILDDGSLWTWGMNVYGQLGDGTKENRNTPKKIMDDVESVSLGYYNGAAVKKDGTLWMWGDNKYGEFGNGTKESSTVPIQVMENVEDVAGGYGTMMALKKDGTVWTWGLNGYGQLGNGVTTTPSTVPVKILEDVQQIDMGNFHGAAVKNDGSLWIWGRNNDYELGDGTRENRNTPIQLMDHVQSVNLGINESSVIKDDGSLWAWGNNENGQIGASQDNYQSDVVTVPIKVLDHVSSASISGKAGAAVTESGELWMWGARLENTVSDKEENIQKRMFAENVLKISLHSATGAVLKKGNTLWTWGYNGLGQTGSGSASAYVNEPVNITSLFAGTNTQDKITARTFLPSVSDFLPETAEAAEVQENTDGTVTAEVTGLTAGELYVLYSMKTIDESDPFTADKMLYIIQLQADENGVIRITFMPRESMEMSVTFAVKMSDRLDFSGNIDDPNYMSGDVDGNGKVDIADLRMILRAVCGKVELTELQKSIGDVEADGKVDIADLRKILRFVCRKIEML